MSNQDPFRNFGANFVENKLGQSSRNEEILDISDYGLSQPNSWFQTTTHLNTSSAMMDDFNFNGYFGGLMMDAPVLTTASMQPDSGITLQPELPSEPDKGQSSGTVKMPDEKVARKCKSEGIQATEEEKRIAKRTRSAEGHNLSERRRRDRINQRLKTLQELVPNSKKSDSATVLDNAANYLKFLKLQIELMSRGVGQVFQAPYMSLNEVAGSQVPQASQFMPIRPQLETGTNRDRDGDGDVWDVLSH